MTDIEVSLEILDEPAEVEFFALAGAPGRQGPQGETGPAGEAGPPGEPGPGITDITQNSDGTLTITVADGSSYVTVPLKGDKGDTGATGPKGDKGDTGEQGAQGPKGDTGEQGAQGPKGDTGNTGYSPVKGTDYWTALDKAAMVNDTMTAMDYPVAVTMVSGSEGVVDCTAQEIYDAFIANKRVVFSGYLGDVFFVAPATTIYKTQNSGVDVIAIQAYAVQMGGDGNYFMTLVMPWSTGSGTAIEIYQDKLGEPDLSDYVQKTDYATSNKAGVVKVLSNGLQMLTGGMIATNPASSALIKSATASMSPIAPNRQHESTFYGLAKAAGDTTQSASSNTVGNYTDTAKTKIKEMLGVETAVTVTGSTPTITAQANHRYVCGTVSSISITPCASGVCDVIFTSGSTPAVLSLPSTVKLPAWFAAGTLEANTVYEINILDGVYGAVMTWQA